MTLGPFANSSRAQGLSSFRPPAAGKGRPRGAKNKKTQAEKLAEARERALKLELEGDVSEFWGSRRILTTMKTQMPRSWSAKPTLKLQVAAGLWGPEKPELFRKARRSQGQAAPIF